MAAFKMDSYCEQQYWEIWVGWHKTRREKITEKEKITHREPLR